MQRILLAAGVIVFVAAAVIGATGAFFSDTETSTGNTFTAGAIDLKIDSEQHYNGNVCLLGDHDENSQTPMTYAWVGESLYPVPGTVCTGSWALTDLQNGVHKFFNFDDIKPGDEGENTISIHIDSNPAWMCADIETTINDDMTCVDPENEAEGTGICGTDGLPTLDGELAQNLDIFTWLDDGNVDGFQCPSDQPRCTADPAEGDNVWQAGEVPLFSNTVGPLSDAIGGKTYALADSTTLGGPLPGGSTQYIGLAWCAGDLTIPSPGTMNCDGSTMGNDAQTDSAVVDVTFRVEQSRNNPNFRCVPEQGPTTGTITIDKIVTFSDQTIAGVDITDFTLHLTGPGGDMVVTDETAVTGLTPGAYTVSEVYSGNPADVTFNGSFTLDCTETGDTGVGTMTLAAGQNLTCQLSNLVSQIPS